MNKCSALCKSLAVLTAMGAAQAARAQQLPAGASPLARSWEFHSQTPAQPRAGKRCGRSSDGRAGAEAPVERQPFIPGDGVAPGASGFISALNPVTSPYAGFEGTADNSSAAKPERTAGCDLLAPDPFSDRADQTTTAAPQPGVRAVSLRRLAPNLLEDQKRIWLSPIRIVKGRHWKPVLGFTVGLAGLVALDPAGSPYFRTTSSFHSFSQVFSSSNASIGMIAFPASFYVVSLVRHNVYDENSSLLVVESVLDSELLATVFKASFRRLRPIEVPPGGNFSDTFFEAKGGLFGGQFSFPSGHTIAAFSIATIFANRYRRHRWVPFVAYGLAAAVGFSRVSLQAHFPSDVLAGAVFGYSISRYAVLPPQTPAAYPQGP
jgi:membrane-associated phospholipid phosphatase